MVAGEMDRCDRQRADRNHDPADARPICRVPGPDHRIGAVEELSARPRFGKCFRRVAKKNAEQSWVPVAPELQAYLDDLTRTSLNIAARTDGMPWDNEKQMQTAVSHYLRRLEKQA